MKISSLAKVKIPVRFAPFLFPFILSGFMTFIVTAISIVKVLGINSVAINPLNFLQLLINAYFSAWIITYPILLLAIPVVSRVVNWLTARDSN